MAQIPEGFKHCIANDSVGLPARTNSVLALAPADNTKVWPRHKNGQLIHGGFLIVKGQEYAVQADVLPNMPYFDEKARKKKSAKEA